MSKKDTSELCFDSEHISIADIYRIGKAIGVLKHEIAVLSDCAARASDAVHQDHDLGAALQFIEEGAGVHCAVERHRLVARDMILHMAEKSK